MIAQSLLPAGLRYDGIMEGFGRQLLQFTETDGGPSHGASFYLDSREADLPRLLARRAEKRQQFAAVPTSAFTAPGFS